MNSTSPIKNHNPRKGTETAEQNNADLAERYFELKIIIPVRGRKLENVPIIVAERTVLKIIIPVRGRKLLQNSSLSTGNNSPLKIIIPVRGRKLTII